MSEKNGLQMKYFVLKPDGATPYHRASRIAIRNYSIAIHDENPTLAKELREWADSVTPDDLKIGER